jgi:hypothetical protein
VQSEEEGDELERKPAKGKRASASSSNEPSSKRRA